MLFKINFDGHILINADSEEDARFFGNAALSGINARHGDWDIVNVEEVE
jgi:hypothetical protein